MIITRREKLKKLLILNASPRKNGNISQMAKELSAKYSALGYETEEVDVLKLKFTPCIACMKCRSQNCCAFNDDATFVGEKISKADIIAVAAPVWWGNIPGHLKSLFDRNVYRMMGESRLGIPVPKLKEKKGIILTACTTPFPFSHLCGQVTGVYKAINEIFKSSGIKIISKKFKAGTRKR